MNDYIYLPFRFPKRDLYSISEYSDKNFKKVSFDVVRLAVDLAYLPE